ncbi:MAG: LacI family DNA-binding transcriptional regulator [Candidatus Vecturithrix sp.]|jgi:DNA-binding LacI/PurR family transcriptional regulator|nr:LacI family DNA-binding transcriptional regulator [Candidatus Vecturithrix sp.]
MPQKIKTIADIAKLAGVSKSTVSRALNDSPLISQETKLRIHAIAREHQFAMHQGARNLSLQRTSVIAFVIPLAPDDDYMVTDPFIHKLVGTYAYALNEYAYDLLIVQVHPEERDWIQKYLDAKRVDGCILCHAQEFAREIVRLARRKAPFIVYGALSPDRSYCSVSGDDLTGGRLATQHLLETGRKRIAFIGGVYGETEVILRHQAYQEILTEAGIAYDPTLVAYGDYTRESGYLAMQQLLRQRPELDAVFANNDVMAIGAIEALREAGRQVPDDVAIVGYDDTVGVNCCPPLTSVRQDIVKIGKIVVRNLMQYLEDGIITTTIMPVELVVRKSSAPSCA